MHSIQDRQEIFHDELIAAQLTFSSLIQALSPTDWKRKCGDKPFSIGEVMMQIAGNLEFLPQVIKDIRRNKGFRRPPTIIIKVIQFFFQGFIGRDLTKEEIGRKYDAANTKVLELLKTIQDNEWEKKAKFFGKYQTIEGAFSSYLTSFYEDIHRIQETVSSFAE